MSYARLQELRTVIDPFARGKSRQYGEAVEAIMMHHGIQCALFGAMVAQGVPPQQAEMILHQEAEMGRWGRPGYAMGAGPGGGMMGGPWGGMMAPAAGPMAGPDGMAGPTDGMAGGMED